MTNEQLIEMISGALSTDVLRIALCASAGAFVGEFQRTIKKWNFKVFLASFLCSAFLTTCIVIFFKEVLGAKAENIIVSLAGILGYAGHKKAFELWEKYITKNTK